MSHDFGAWVIWIDDVDGELAMKRTDLAATQIEVIEALPALNKISSLEKQIEYLKKDMEAMREALHRQVAQ